MKNINRLNDFLKEYSKKKDICDAFSSFARKSSGDRDEIDELILLQDEYRKGHGWDNKFHCLIEAGGYLGQRYNETVDYFFEKLISSEEDKADYRYFLSYCLTIAAKINPHATELLWNLSFFAQALAYQRLGSYIEKEFEEEHYEISSDVTRGMADSRELFDIASPEVITFLIDKLASVSLPSMERLLAQALGDNPVVQCQVFDVDGNYSIINQDFSKQTLPLLRNINLFGISSPIGDLFSKWCREDLVYKSNVIRTLDDHETYVVFLIDYLKMRIKNLDFDISDPSSREVIKILAERKRKEVDVDAEIDRLKEDKVLFEKSVSRLENKETREAEFEFQMKVANRAPEVIEFIDWMKNKILNRIAYHAI
jgi:hypothetical protein